MVTSNEIFEEDYEMEKFNKINFEQPKNPNFKAPRQQQSASSQLNQTPLNS